MTLNIGVPTSGAEPHIKPKITVCGVGGAGGNAVNNMIESALDGVEFVVANTDAQALSLSRTDRRIQLGIDTTQGLGAGARPDIGRHAAEECVELLGQELQGSNMAFVTAGMGGGTGTGAAPVVARIARELGILTVGVVTKPFQFEGAHRMRLAEAGIEELAQYVDTLIVIPNQNLFRVANEHTTFADAFKMADDVLYSGVRSVTDLMMMPGLINLDFADVQTVMKEMGRAMMGTGEAEGERRALEAAEAAIANPLLEDTCMKGARGVLINITGGSDITLFEVDEAANRIRDEVETDAHIIFGSCFDETLEGRIRVSVVATGIEAQSGIQPRPMLVRDETDAPKAPVMLKPEPAPAPEPIRPAAIANAVFGAGPKPVTPAADIPAAPAETPVQVPAAANAPSPAPTLAPAAATTRPPADEIGLSAEPAAKPAEPLAQPAQAAAVAEAMANAPKPQMPSSLKTTETFIPKAPVAPRGMDAPPPASEPAPQPVKAETPKPLAKPEAAPVKRESSKLSLFSKYRNLSKGNPEKTEEPIAEAPAKAEPAKPVPAAKPAAQAALNISVNPDDRPVTSHDEEELEIPAFLRRQAN